jgi:Rho guanine nucleotide exchange factor 12
MKHFSGDNGDTLKNQCAHFCKDQSFALEYLRQAQRKDPYLAQFIQNAALDPLCKKQELKDFVLKIMVRLTKYPLLVDSLIKCTPPDTEEITSLQDVLPLMKGVLHFINQIVKECENYRRSQSMQKRLDHKPIENSKNPVLIEHKNLDMTKHTIIYDGDLTWVLNDKSVDLHVVLFTDLFVILHKQDNRLVLRCINTSIEDTKYQHVPIIRLTGLMIRDIPRDNHAFHLINASKEDSQMYKMVAKSKEERDNWCKYIREAVENFKNQYSSQQSQTSQTSQSTLSNLSTTSNDQPDSAGSVDSSYDALDNSTLAPIDLVLESMECTESGEKLIHPSEVVFNEVEERSSFHDLPAGPEYELKKRVLAIQTQMTEKMKALCDIHHTTISCDNRPTSLKLSMDCQQFMETAIAMVVYMTQFFSELPEELSDPEGSVAESEYIESLLALGEELKKLVQQLEEMIRVKEDAEKSDVPTNLLKVPGSPEQSRFIRPTSYTAALSSSDFSLDETDSSDKNTDKNT